MLQHIKHSSGFTLIELLIVFSLLAIISTIGIAAFSSYSQNQNLRNAALSIKTLLQEARTDATSQVNSCSTSSTFQGYALQLCCSSYTTGCPSCTSGNDYEIDAICSGSPTSTYTTVANTGGKFPTGVSLNISSTTQRSFQFIPITGGVVGGGKVVINGANTMQQTITVSSTGVIK